MSLEHRAVDPKLGWISAHLHFHGALYGNAGDVVIADIVGPIVDRGAAEGWLAAFFFVRYSDTGPHIRLRLRGEPDALSRFAVPGVDELEGVLVRWQDYEPEIERYGGSYALPLAERFFHDSSRSILDWLQLARPEHTARLGQGLLLLIIFSYVFCRDRATAVEFLRAYERAYLGVALGKEAANTPPIAFQASLAQQTPSLVETVRGAWELLAAEESLSPLGDSYRAACEVLFRELSILAKNGDVLVREVPTKGIGMVRLAIAPSFAHMTNNRLGIPIMEEAFLAYLVRSVLSEEV